MDLPLQVLDANANRAREGLRTAEDYVRFELRQGAWAEQLKRSRQSVTAALEGLGLGAALAGSRNAGFDPLRSVDRQRTAPAGLAGLSGMETPRDVAVRGLKRAQEALRVLEEYVRAANSASAQAFSELRYAAYEAEQKLICVAPALQVLGHATLYVLITENLCKKGLTETTAAVLKAGVKALQLREKALPKRVRLEQARELRSRCNDAGAVLICNDDADLALASGADGVHVGQDDLPPQSVRQICGERLLIGRSTHAAAEAERAVREERADYIGIGAMYDTATKPERTLRGPQLAEQVSELKLNVPVFAIGGITAARIPELKRCGVTQFAVSAAVISAADPERAARGLLEAAAG